MHPALDFDHDGVEIIPDFVSLSVVQAICSELNLLNATNIKGGIRRIDQQSSYINKFIKSNHVMGPVRRFIGSQAAFVRGILFDKTPQNNWGVLWHQDKTIAVSQRLDIQDWGPWTVKAGINHVQPPLNVLNSMVTIRLHLDDASQDNGCLKVIKGSHKDGIIPSKNIMDRVQASDILHCTAKKGDAIIMRPHLIHGSAKSEKPSQRRVLHMEFSSAELPSGLSWMA